MSFASITRQSGIKLYQSDRDYVCYPRNTKYAMRALLMLAEARPDELVLVQEIAERQNVPRKFLELILLELKRHGFVFSQRGRGGGYCLARPGDTITFGQVVRAIDGPLAPLPCASVSGYRRCADCTDERTSRFAR